MNVTEQCSWYVWSVWVEYFWVCIKSIDVTNQLKVILSCGWNPKVWTFKPGSYWAVLFCDAYSYAVQGGFNFWVCGWNSKVWPFKWNLLSSTFLWYSFKEYHMLYKVALTFDSVDEKLEYKHPNESHWPVLSTCRNVYYVLQCGFRF